MARTLSGNKIENKKKKNPKQTKRMLGRLVVDPPNSRLDWAACRWEVRGEEEVGVDKREWGERTSAEEESVSTDYTSHILHLIQPAWRELAAETRLSIFLSLRGRSPASRYDANHHHDIPQPKPNQCHFFASLTTFSSSIMNLSAVLTKRFCSLTLRSRCKAVTSLYIILLKLFSSPIPRPSGFRKTCRRHKDVKQNRKRNKTCKTTMWQMENKIHFHSGPKTRLENKGNLTFFFCLINDWRPIISHHISFYYGMNEHSS